MEHVDESVRTFHSLDRTVDGIPVGTGYGLLIKQVTPTVEPSSPGYLTVRTMWSQSSIEVWLTALVGEEYRPVRQLPSDAVVRMNAGDGVIEGSGRHWIYRMRA